MSLYASDGSQVSLAAITPEKIVELIRLIDKGSPILFPDNLNILLIFPPNKMLTAKSLFNYIIE